MLDTEILPTCAIQNVKKLSSNCFDITINDTRSMTHKEFETLSEKNAMGLNFTNMNEAEDMFWRQVCVGEKIYGINIPTTLFGDETKVWNLDKFTKDHSDIHSKPSHRQLIVSMRYCILGVRSFPFRNIMSLIVILHITTFRENVIFMLWKVFRRLYYTLEEHLHHSHGILRMVTCIPSITCIPESPNFGEFEFFL